MSYRCSKLSISIGTIGYITIKACSVGLGSRMQRGLAARTLKVMCLPILHVGLFVN
jgi:hypothetical protein